MNALVSTIIIFLVLGTPAARADGASTSCTTCHADTNQVGPELTKITEEFPADVHAQVGLSCHDCHGGNPNPDLAADMQAAKATDDYRGAPDRSWVPDFCGRCHIYPRYMKRFRPDARVDQVREYWTSKHGELLMQGDTNVATCIDCHGAHDIRRPSDPQSRVYPTRVAETCRGCHADPERMKGYTLPDGRPLPVDQYQRWARSVHATALLEKEDLSAPTCNDCHGNHGAAPPGLQAVGFVCGQCHGREAELFRNSPKKDGFEQHNTFLETVEPGDELPCASCHSEEAPETVRGVHSFGECTTCHGNHAIIRPTMAMLGPLPATPCEFCHAPSDGSPEALVEGREHFEQIRDALLETAEQNGLNGDALFDWLVEQMKQLPPHTEGQRIDEAGQPVMKAEVRQLFEKFRIGATHFTFQDPTSGKTVEQSIIRCTSCHGATLTTEDGKTEPSASAIFLERMKTLTTDIARAERILLRAHRGGVATTQATVALDSAVDSQIELEVLVHSFVTEENSAFAQTAAEGTEHARIATELGLAALDELEYRRQGLAGSLAIILLVLIGLGLKIRELARRRQQPENGADSQA